MDMHPLNTLCANPFESLLPQSQSGLKGSVKSYGSMVLFFSNRHWDGLCTIVP